MTSEFLFCEKYRPKVIDDCILPDDTKKTFKEFVEKGEIPNLLLAGPPGIGKSELRVGISSFTGDSGTSDQSVIGSENQRHRVEQVQFFLHGIKVKQMKEKAT